VATTHRRSNYERRCQAFVRERCRIAYVILACVVLLTIISVGRLMVPLLF
jgi:hypothetical protein